LRPAVEQLWEASDYLWSKRLAPFLPELLQALERHEEMTRAADQRTALRTSAPATIDRLLHPIRRLHRPHGVATMRPSVAAVGARVPVRTFGEWTDVKPGALQMDLVAHCGESTHGLCLTSLLTVDVATGWTESRAAWARATGGSAVPWPRSARRSQCRW